MGLVRSVWPLWRGVASTALSSAEEPWKRNLRPYKELRNGDSEIKQHTSDFVLPNCHLFPTSWCSQCSTNRLGTCSKTQISVFLRAVPGFSTLPCSDKLGECKGVPPPPHLHIVRHAKDAPRQPHHLSTGKQELLTSISITSALARGNSSPRHHHRARQGQLASLTTTTLLVLEPSLASH